MNARTVRRYTDSTATRPWTGRDTGVHRGDEGTLSTPPRSERLIRRISALKPETGLSGSFAHLGSSAALLLIMTMGYAVYAADRTVLSSVLLSSLVTISGGFGKVILGGISDSVRRNRLLVAVTLATFLSYALFFSSFGFALDMAGALSMGFFSASIFPVMQALMTDSGGATTGSALGLSTSSQSVATIFSPIIAASLFTLGVGRAVALDAMIPIALAFVVALFLREPRRTRVS